MRWHEIIGEQRNFDEQRIRDMTLRRLHEQKIQKASRKGVDTDLFEHEKSSGQKYNL